MADGFVFPAFLQLKYQSDGRAASEINSEMRAALDQGRRQFSDFANDAQESLRRATSLPRNNVGSLDLGVSQLREQLQTQDALAISAREYADALSRVAAAEGFRSQTTREALSAAKAEAATQEGLAASLAERIRLENAVQAELNLSQSRASALTSELLALAQAEAGAAEGARLVEAAHKGTALELGRVTISARESAAAFELMFQATEARTTKAAQDFFNTAFGIDAQTKSARESAAAFQELERAELDMLTAQRQLNGEFVEMARLEAAAAEGARLVEAAHRGTALEIGRTTKSARDSAQAFAQLGATQLRGTTAQQSMINSQRASRVAFIQLGQQMQDVTVQAQMGTNAFQIFAQQVPQAAFALSGLERSANATQAKIGAVATFLSGPWGAAIFAGTAVLGPFIYSLIRSGDEAEAAASAIESLDDEINFAIISAEQLTQVNELLAEANSEVERTALAAANATRAKALADRDAAQEALDHARAELALREAVFEASAATGYLPGQGQMDRLEDEIDSLQQAISGFGVSARRSEFDAATLTAGMNEQERAAEQLQTQINELRDSYSKLGNPADLAAAERLQRQLEALNAGGKSGGSSGGRSRAARLSDEQRAAIRAAEASDQYIESLALEITRIGLSERELRQLEVTRQLEAATTDEQRAAIEALNAVRERAIELQEREARETALDKGYEDLVLTGERRVEQMRLQLAGRDDEARALSIIWQWEDKIGAEARDRYDAVLDQVRAEREVTEELERRQFVLDSYLQTTKSIRGELESFFAGEGANFGKLARRLQSQILVENLFGDALREINEVTRSGFDRNVDYLARETDRAGDAAGALADELIAATSRIAGFPVAAAAGQPANDNDTIVVSANRELEQGVAGMSPEEYFDLVGKKLVEPILFGLEQQIGVNLAGKLSDLLGGAAGGYLAAGPVGGVLGALRGLFPNSSAIGGAFGGGIQGQQIAAISNSLGLGLSNSGAAIGGAIGSFLPVPGGSIIGSLAGGAIGSLGLGSRQLGLALGGPITYGLMHALGIGGTKYGTANISGIGASNITGSGNKRRDGASTLAGTFESALSELADVLGADIGGFDVSIGTVKDNFRVSTIGRNKKLKKKYADVSDFGEDEAAAQAYALMAAIADGAILGLKESEQRLLQGSDDLDKALQDVLDFRDVFKRLKAYTDPVGAALDDLNEEFAQLEDLFERASASAAEYAQLEELYAIERANAIEDATRRMTGSLRDLLDELTIGDSGLSLIDRQQNALGEYNALADRVAAGDTTAFDDFAEAARALLEIEREIYGSQQGYFDRFNEVRNLTEGALAEQDRLAQEAAAGDNPFGTGGTPGDAPLIAAIDRGNSAVVEELRLLNSNFARFGSTVAANNNSLPNNRLGRYASFADNF